MCFLIKSHFVCLFHKELQAKRGEGTRRTSMRLTGWLSKCTADLIQIRATCVGQHALLSVATRRLFAFPTPFYPFFFTIENQIFRTQSPKSKQSKTSEVQILLQKKLGQFITVKGPLCLILAHVSLFSSR